MKFVLIIVLFPTAWQFGSENHIKFDSEEQCQSALNSIKTGRDGLMVCVPEENEFWYYKDSKND